MEKKDTEVDHIKRPKILLTEDDDLIAQAYAASLVREGFEVIFAKGGEEAIEALEADPPDLMLLDVAMAGKDGFQILQIMKEKRKLAKIPVIILSNIGDATDIDKGKKLGALEYMVKANNSIQDVIKNIKKYVGNTAKIAHKNVPTNSEKRKINGEPLTEKNDTIDKKKMNEAEKKEKPSVVNDGESLMIPKKGAKKILLTEDEEFIARAYRDGLMRAGFHVRVASGGEEAIRMLREEKPDMLLLDLIMAGVNGFEVLEQMQNDQELRKIPVMILSNLGQESDVKKGKELGAVDYLVKSDFSMKQVIDKVRENLKRLGGK
jgi:DNA-binding response OmpR family regulator